MKDADTNRKSDKLVAVAIQPQLKYPLCVFCEKVFLSSANLKSHLERKHSECSREAKDRADRIVEAANKELSREIIDQREIYGKAPLGTEGKSICDSLPALVGVEKARALKCPICDYYIVKRKNMQQHIQKHHDQSEQDAWKQADPLVHGLFTVQTLQGGNQTRFFRVHDEDDGGGILNFPFNPEEVRQDAEPNPNPEKEKKDAEHNAKDISSKPPSSHRYDLEFFADACEEGELQVCFNEQDEECTETHNDFIAATRAPDILMQEGIDVEEAARLTGQMDTEVGSIEKELTRLSQIYLEKVASCASTAAPALLYTLFPREDKSFEPVGKNTVKRYSHHLANMLMFSIRSASSKWVGSTVSKALNELSALVSSPADDDMKLANVHKVLKETCLVRRCKSAGVQRLFIRTYFGCMCVVVNRSRRGITHRFVEASELPHALAALQHFILGAALLELRAISETVTQIPGRTKSENNEEELILRGEEEKILLRVSSSENTALSFVRIILNICWGIMERDTASFKIVHCKSHDYCGFIRGVELSMPVLGQCLRKWQQECREIMNKEMLCGGTYPPDLQDFISNAKDICKIEATDIRSLITRLSQSFSLGGKNGFCEKLQKME